MNVDKKSAANGKTKEPECKGQTFGHSFPGPGADCLRCHVNQDDLSGRKLRRLAPAFGDGDVVQ